MFSAKTGVAILGFLSILSLFSEFNGFEPLRFGANLSVAVTFIVM